MDIIEIAKECGAEETDIGDDLFFIYRSEIIQFYQRIQPQWQPIETAPKDGTEILVTYGKQGFVMQLVRFDRTFNYWKSKGKAELGLENNATHWMPIPQPQQVTK